MARKWMFVTPYHLDKDGNPIEGICPYCQDINHFTNHEELKEHLLRGHRHEINEGLRRWREARKRKYGEPTIKRLKCLPDR